MTIPAVPLAPAARPMSIRVGVSLVVDMTAEQVAAYALEYGLPHHDGPLRARDIADHVRESVLSDLLGSVLGEFSDISVKGR